MSRISPKATRWAAIAGVLAVAAIYLAAWLTPAIGLYHDDAMNLITAKAIAAGHGYSIDSLPTPAPQTQSPPLFPAILALFTLISANTQWLKALPLLCSIAAAILYWRLLRRMGASDEGAALIVLLAAASPTVVFLGTNLMPEPLFALLVAACLLSLLDDRAALAGIFAGLATLTRSAGLPLIAACALILLLRGRFRRAITFTAFSMLLAAPWFGWSIAHAPRDVTGGLQLSEKAVALANNTLYLFAGPWALLTGVHDLWAALVTFALLVWSFWRRRQIMPDLFLALYCLMLLCTLGSQKAFLAPVLPLVLWIFWRAARTVQLREGIAAAVIILVVLVGYVNFTRLIMLTHGQYPSSDRQPTDWSEIQRLSAFLRANTPQDAVIAANLAPVFYLNTGRKAIRGFFPNTFKILYEPSGIAVTPDVLSASIARDNAAWVILTPDRDLPESPAYRRSVEALERGGLLEPVPVPNLAPDFRLLQVVSNRR